MSSNAFDDRIKEHRLRFEARQQRNSYFEKLALLDGATVSLVITAALSKFPEAFRHKYTLGVALTSLVAAMLTLLYRNHLATSLEFHEASMTAYMDMDQSKIKAVRILNNRKAYAQTAGVWLSAIGVFLLLVEVWLVLLSR